MRPTEKSSLTSLTLFFTAIVLAGFYSSDAAVAPSVHRPPQAVHPAACADDQSRRCARALQAAEGVRYQDEAVDAGPDAVAPRGGAPRLRYGLCDRNLSPCARRRTAQGSAGPRDARGAIRAVRSH